MKIKLTYFCTNEENILYKEILKNKTKTIFGDILPGVHLGLNEDFKQQIGPIFEVEAELSEVSQLLALVNASKEVLLKQGITNIYLQIDEVKD